MNCVVFRFTDRNPANVSNKYLKEIHTGIGPKHDLELIASDQQVVKAHTLVMEMFSEFIRDYLFEFKPTKNPICSKIKPAQKKKFFFDIFLEIVVVSHSFCSVSLPNISSFVLRFVVDLIYNGEVMVGEEVKPRIGEALNQLKIAGVKIKNPDDKETPPPPPTPSAKPPPAVFNRKYCRISYANGFVKIRLILWISASLHRSGPIPNVQAPKSMSGSMTNLQQIQNPEAYKRELSVNSIQTGNVQPAKRPRAQSV